MTGIEKKSKFLIKFNNKLPLLIIKSISAGKKCGSFYLKCKQA